MLLSEFTPEYCRFWAHESLRYMACVLILNADLPSNGAVGITSQNKTTRQNNFSSHFLDIIIKLLKQYLLH